MSKPVSNVFAEDNIGDTCHKVACGLEILESLRMTDTGGCSDNSDFGLFLILQNMRVALEAHSKTEEVES